MMIHFNKICVGFILLIFFSFGRSFGQELSEENPLLDQYRDSVHYRGELNLPKLFQNGSVSTIKGKELESSYVDDLFKTLYGRLPGLLVRPDAQNHGPNSPTNLRIRGQNSFQASNEPLVIIDGFRGRSITRGNVIDLNPYEIESIEIHKDAISKAMYGQEAANGVIYITTKKGRNSPLEVNFSAKGGFRTPFRMPEYLGSLVYPALFNEALINDGRSTLYTMKDFEGYMNRNDPDFYPDVDWYRETLKNVEAVSDIDLNFSGGNENVTYFADLNMVRNGTILKRPGRDRKDVNDLKTGGTIDYYNFRGNLNARLTNSMNFFLNFNAVINDKYELGTEGDLSSIGGLYNSFFDVLERIPPNSFPVYNPDGSFGGNNTFNNPVGLAANGTYEGTERTLFTTFGLKQDLDFITPGLSVTAGGSYSSQNLQMRNTSRGFERFAISKGPNGDTLYSGFGDATPIGIDHGFPLRWSRVTPAVHLNYERTFGKHQLNGVVFGDVDWEIVVGQPESYKHAGLSGNFNYVYDNKYIGQFSFGYRGSGFYDRAHMFGFFPAGALGWIISKEDFLKESESVNLLKIRGSYGVSGNDATDLYFLYQEDYGSSPSYYFGSSNRANDGLQRTQVPNTEATWEKQYELNIGVDAVLFDHVNLNLDVFKIDRNDQMAISYLKIPRASGLDLPYTNIGKVSNKGIEVALGYFSNPKEKFHFSANLIVNYAKNKIIENGEEFQIDEYLYRKGHPINQPFVLEALGLFQDQEDIDNSPLQLFDAVKPGDIKYKDQNGDGVIDGSDVFPVGKPSMGEINGSLNIKLNYGSFDVSALFQGIGGRDIWLNDYTLYRAFQNNGKISEVALYRWTPDNRENATYPRLSSVNNNNNYRASTFWQKNGDFVYLRYLEIGYRLPTSLLEKVKLKGGRVFAQGQNLFSLDHLEQRINPELQSGYPLMQSFILGFNVNF